MQVSLSSAAIGRGDTASIGGSQSGEPQGKIAQLEAKAAKIREQIKALADKKEEGPADPQAAKAQQEQIKVLQQQLEMIMAEIARLQAEATKKEESTSKEQAAPSTTATASNLPMNSTFSITV
ncbi:TPA: FlxA-like family protein [Aeromonas sobria]|nr:FlxA-like family protein [Aeromonas sobria]